MFCCWDLAPAVAVVCCDGTACPCWCGMEGGFRPNLSSNQENAIEIMNLTLLCMLFFFFFNILVSQESKGKIVHVWLLPTHRAACSRRAVLEELGFLSLTRLMLGVCTVLHLLQPTFSFHHVTK